MASVLTSYDLYKGKTGKIDKTGLLSQPRQFLPRAEKDEKWRKENLDWWEYIGVTQLRNKGKRIKKNYNLAAGIIDKSDYVPDPQANEYGEMIDILSKEGESPYEIRFYPIIPNIVKVLVGEFSKRNNRVHIKAVDEYSINEMLNSKKEKITEYVLTRLKSSLAVKLAEQGVDVESEQGQQALDSVETLPQIQEFFQKSYRSIAEQWAVHELADAEERFKLYELETLAFTDKIIANEEFWHIKVLEDDYEVELWNPLNTFYHKSQNTNYISEGDYVGRINLMTIADVIDSFGYLMTEDQIKSLETLSHKWITKGALMPADATTTDYWNPTKKPNEQIKSIHWHQAVASESLFNSNFNKPFFSFLQEAEDNPHSDYLNVTEVYWKSQKRMGHLKEIREDGSLYEDIVSEDYVVTRKPVYDVTITKEKTKDNLIDGQHVDWIWVNEVWKGIKIGLSFVNSWAGMSDGFDPIYLDVRPLPFQFKPDGSLYKAKLPVEGFVGYSRGTKNLSIVNQCEPFQIGYNFTNNQIVDMMVDEVGKVIMFDQNMIPRNSMDGTWGKHNFTKAYQVMKNFGIMPIDSSITNTETPVSFGQTSAVDLGKTDQLTSRLTLSEYFKNECFNTVGITRQRLGNITSSESATGVEYSVNNSYAQTEMLFVEHSNYLMPRVKEMILNAAQFINANKPTIRKTYINADEENVFFEVEGTKILLADLKIYCTSKPDQRAILEQLKQLAINNNTSGATIFDLAKIVQSNSVTEIIETLKSSVDTVQKQQEADREAQQQMVQQQIEAQASMEEARITNENEQKELDRANERYVAEVRALGFSKDPDLNDNSIHDALEVAKFNAEMGKTQGDMALKQQKLDSDNLKSLKDRELKEKTLEFQRKKLAEEIRLKEEALKVQRENDKADIQLQKMKNRQAKKK